MLIDCHVHMFSESELREAGDAPAVAAERFGRTLEWETVEKTISAMDAGGVDAAVLIPMPTPTLDVRRNNREIASWVGRDPDRLVGFGSVNVADPASAVDEIRYCVEELGLVGLKFHPPAQEFFPNDPALRPIWKECERRSLPVMLHTGTTWWGYSKVKFGRPELIDDLACDFRDLTIVMTHWGQPWWEECAAIAWRHPNVYVDISGYGPKHVPARFRQLANSVLQDKVVFGTDYPSLGFARFVEDFRAMSADLRPEVVRKISSENIRRAVPALRDKPFIDRAARAGDGAPQR